MCAVLYNGIDNETKECLHCPLQIRPRNGSPCGGGGGGCGVDGGDGGGQGIQKMKNLSVQNLTFHTLLLPQLHPSQQDKCGENHRLKNFCQSSLGKPGMSSLDTALWYSGLHICLLISLLHSQNSSTKLEKCQCTFSIHIYLIFSFTLLH